MSGTSHPNPAPRCSGAETGNVTPLLNEVMHALERLHRQGEATVIDLLGVPLAPGEARQLDAALGRGEIRAELEALGPSILQESQFPGVWIVTHHNAHGELVGRFIEVARVPSLLPAQPQDIAEGVARLRALLRPAHDEAPPREARSQPHAPPPKNSLDGDQDHVRDTG